MSDHHTKGRIVSEPFTDVANAMYQLRAADTVLFQDGILARFVSAENARRLAACWNSWESVGTDVIEDVANNGCLDALVRVSARAMKAELQLAAACALLQEISDADGPTPFNDISREFDSSGAIGLMTHIRSYLDASDKKAGAS